MGKTYLNRSHNNNDALHFPLSYANSPFILFISFTIGYCLTDFRS